MDLEKMRRLTQNMENVNTGANDNGIPEEESEELNYRGVEACNSKNYGIAVELWTKAAKAGNVTAMSNLGYIYQEIFEDHNEAFKWCKKAAEGGDADSMFEVGIYYYRGEYVEKDVFKSFGWCKKAAENGIVSAMNWVGEFYRDGEGVKQDLQAAFHWFKKSANGGNEHAKQNMEELERQTASSSTNKASLSGTFSIVRRIVVEQLGAEPDEVQMSSTFVEDLGADSLDIVELIMAFEEEFNIEVPDEKAEKMRTVGDVVKYIDSGEGA